MPWTEEQLAAILGLVSFRALPFVGYSILSPRFRVFAKGATLAAFGALICASVTTSPDLGSSLFALPWVYAYLALVSALLPAVARATSAGWIGKFPLCVALLLVYVALPGGMAPQAMVLPFLILGWDSVLKAFSYCVDNSALRTPLSKGELAFFMLVSPTLVLAERGTPLGPPRLERTGVFRCTLGVVAFLAEDFLRWAALLLPLGSVRAVAIPFTFAIAYYFSHSGLASLQIGFMRLVGYEVPERYLYPTLATNPIDFWRRWNTWIGSWARRYVFAPVSIKLRRHWRSTPTIVVQGVAVLATFTVVGALHDALQMAKDLQRGGAISIAVTVMFVLFGTATMLWAGVERGFRAGSARSRPYEARPSAAKWRAVLSYMAFVPLALGMYWLAHSALAGQGLPPPFPRLADL